MGDSIDEVLDGLTPAELAAVEAEINKTASDNSVKSMFAAGVKMAREAAEGLKTGQVHPAMVLVKAAAARSELDAALDKCSAEELAELETEVDAKIASSRKDAGYKTAGAWLAQIMKVAMPKVAKASPKVKPPQPGPTIGESFKGLSGVPVSQAAMLTGVGYLAAKATD